MGFTLTHIRTGQKKSFTTKALLEILGDRVNDEIRINGERYRISSATSSDSGSGTGEYPASWRPDWKKVDITVLVWGQTQFPFSASFSDPEGLFLVVNGALYDYGLKSAFHINNGILYWHGAFILEVHDTIYIKYLTLISN